MRIAINDLEVMINDVKVELIKIVETTGINSNYTLLCSEKLDELITIYQKHFFKGNKVV